MRAYSLLTGATGLIGNYLIGDLLRRDHRLALLVRPSRRATAVERIEVILQRWEREHGQRLPRPVVCAGDVSREGLGISADDRRWISEHCNRIIHNAAILTFIGSDRAGEPWRTNLEGTRHTIKFCRETGIGDYHFVSTAYVCGKRQGTILEEELDLGQDFRNDYEQSKCLAEQAVRRAGFPCPPTIYRPVVIAGDSRTGYTNTYHGLYVYLRLISLALDATQPGVDGRRHSPLRVPLSGDERRNVVPVDWVSRVLAHLIDTPAAHGRTFHLAPRVPITARDLFEAAYSYYNSYGVEYCGSAWNGGPDTTMFEEIYLTMANTYKDYERTDPTFDTSNLNRFAGHLACPAIGEPMLHRFWRYGEQDRWGKRPQPKHGVTIWAKDLVEVVISAFDLVSSQPPPKSMKTNGAVGLDIVGRGGGQWQIAYNGRGEVTATPGLPLNGHPVLHFTTEELAHAVGIDAVAEMGSKETGSKPALSISERRRSLQFVQTLLRHMTGHRLTADDTERQDPLSAAG